MTNKTSIEVEEIFKTFEQDLKLLEEELAAIFKSSSFLIPAVSDHILKSGGKRLRPLYLLLSAELSGYRERPRLMLASVIEAIHTASLLHDDVVDGAEVRRGNQTSHTIWGNQAVILVGDYVYANALRTSVEQKNLAIIEALSKAIMRMAEGELLQLHKTADPMLTEDEYMSIISGKTGALFSAACRVGGLLGDLSEEKLDALTGFGLKTGIVYQMSDDILDFDADEENFGKMLGKDLEEGKITLPLIYLLKSANDPEREKIKDIIEYNDKDEDRDKRDLDLKKIHSMLKKYNIIDLSLEKAKQLAHNAKRELFIFDDSPQKDSLLAMTDYAFMRRK